ncbi:MAG: low molecular weight protein-tyrosine-phosphatase [Alcanivorax sp.]|uniref:low molecular weight protein-tyrosine-phosphatase n=1 Tax=Alloalcanivorax marinus TaxID=1177169 RepID=UPI0021D33B63|nr:low molecular weight protein-tyrosine-phosphatase [Alloalcanivorax marinus]MCU5787465.1 cytoplasmic phosphatase [Alloalcanivorax marinus]
MFERILVVCDGNICRSPTAAGLLAAHKPGVEVTSAGLVGLEGHGMDATALAVAEAHGMQGGDQHRARKLTGELCRLADLILVMEGRQRERIIQRFPEASGKTMLLTHWTGGRDIPDPFRQSREVHERIHPMIRDAVAAWAAKL